MKTCRSCKENKDLPDFVNNKAFKSGKDTICLACSRAKVKNWRKGKKNSRGQARSTTKGYRDAIISFLIERDGFVCGICRNSLEGSDIHINHILPWALGGLHRMDNFNLTHKECNMQQGRQIRQDKHGF